MRTKHTIIILERGMFQPQIDPEFIVDADEIPDTVECRYTYHAPSKKHQPRRVRNVAYNVRKSSLGTH